MFTSFWNKNILYTCLCLRTTSSHYNHTLQSVFPSCYSIALDLISWLTFAYKTFCEICQNYMYKDWEGVFSYKIKEFNKKKKWESSYLRTGKLIENKEKSFSFNHFQNNLANTRKIKDYFLSKNPPNYWWCLPLPRGYLKNIDCQTPPTR